MGYERRLIATLNHDGLSAGYSYNHMAKTITMVGTVVEGIKSALGRGVVLDVDVSTLREMVAFAERCEEDNERGGVTTTATIEGHL